MTSKLETKTSSRRTSSRSPQNLIELRLYIAGQTPKSVAALKNLKRICEEHMPDTYELKVIDLLKQPQLARGDQIVAVPTVVKNLPVPIRKLIGDLSDTERVLIGLDLHRRD
jgi:circadian clock protein KaiB